MSPAKPGPTGPAAPAATAASPQIQLVPASAEGALDAAEEAVDLLLDSGRAPGDVLVITTGAQHPWAEHELSFGESGGPATAAATALPLAHSRAGALLIVCGDPQQINSVLGAGV